MTRTVTLYSTTTCSTCRVAEARLKAAGITPKKVVLDLPENAERLAELKRIRETDIINVPLIQYGTTYRQIDGLTDIINQHKEATNG